MTDLTEQWKKGELPEGLYYVENNEGNIGILGWSKFAGWYNIKQVLAPVPSYDELQNINKVVNECMNANIKLVEQNKQLKELLKECKKAFQELSIGYKYCIAGEMADEMLQKIDEVLNG